MVYVWDRWPEYFRGRLRVEYDATGAVRYHPRPRLAWNEAASGAARGFRSQSCQVADIEAGYVEVRRHCGPSRRSHYWPHNPL
jgi:hypothetical protein